MQGGVLRANRERLSILSARLACCLLLPWDQDAYLLDCVFIAFVLLDPHLLLYLLFEGEIARPYATRIGRMVDNYVYIH